MNPHFSTSILDEVIENRRKGREEERLKVLGRIEEALDRLSNEVAFEGAYIFGSVAKPYRFIKDSDIDIGFTGLKDEDFFRAAAFLSRMLEREVDVLQLEGHRMERMIKREGIRWKKEG